MADILDRIDQHPDFDPARDYRLTLRGDELSAGETGFTPVSSVNDITLDL